MNMIKKVFAVVLCVAMLFSLTAVSTLVSAEEAAVTSVEGIRWFPVPTERQNDDAWEVECVKEGCLCQRFTETAEDTGNANFLDTVYTDKGGLTITRNGNDATEGNYWPRIRTISLETSPELDLKTANTFYFDFEVAEGTQWNVMLSINGINIKLSKVISDAAGVSGVANSDADGVAGTYKGSFNIQDAIEELSKEAGTESATNAVALKNMKKTFVPQIAVFCVGAVGANLTLNEMFISTADDTAGEKTTFVDMGLLSGYGDEYYEVMEGEEGDEPAADGDEPAEDPSIDEPASPDEGPVTDGTPAVDGEDEKDEPTTTTTKAAADDKDDDKGGSVLPIVIIVVAVVVVAVVVIVVLKKKKA